MKLVFDKADLVKSVGIAMKAVSGKTTMPILECILIDASSNVIKFTSNDMELGIETIVTGMILERGVVALDAKIFSEIVRKLPDNQVTIETDENLVTTITGFSKLSDIFNELDDGGETPVWKCVQEMEDEWVQKGVAEGERKGEIKGMQKDRQTLYCILYTKYEKAY